jgi:hypothetical protein
MTCRMHPPARPQVVRAVPPALRAGLGTWCIVCGAVPLGPRCHRWSDAPPAVQKKHTAPELPQPRPAARFQLAPPSPDTKPTRLEPQSLHHQLTGTHPPPLQTSALGWRPSRAPTSPSSSSRYCPLCSLHHPFCSICTSFGRNAGSVTVPAACRPPVNGPILPECAATQSQLCSSAGSTCWWMHCLWVKYLPAGDDTDHPPCCTTRLPLHTALHSVELPGTSSGGNPLQGSAGAAILH